MNSLVTVSWGCLQEDQDLEHGAAGAAGALLVVGLAAAATHDTPTGALLGSAVAASGGTPKVLAAAWSTTLPCAQLPTSC